MALVQGAVAQKRKLVTTNYIIAELIALMTARLRLACPQVLGIIDLIHSMQQARLIHIDPALDAAALALLKARPDKEWSLVDAASFLVMSAEGIAQALTTDHHFEQAGYVRLLV